MIENGKKVREANEENSKVDDESVVEDKKTEKIEKTEKTEKTIKESDTGSKKKTSDQNKELQLKETPPKNDSSGGSEDVDDQVMILTKPGHGPKKEKKQKNKKPV